MKTCTRTIRTDPAWEEKLRAGAAARGQTVQAYIIDCVNRDIEFQILSAADHGASLMQAIYAKGKVGA